MKALALDFQARLKRCGPSCFFLLGLLYVLGLGLLDYCTPAGVSFTLFYLLGAAFVGWHAGRARALTLAAVATGIILLIEWFFGTIGGPGLVVWNGSTRLALFGLSGWAMAQMARMRRRQDQLVQERTAQWQAETQQHKATATRLAESLERYRAILATAMDGFAMMSPEGRILEVNEAYGQILGYQPQELVGKHVTDLEIIDSPAEVSQRIARLRASGGDRFETRHRHKDGQHIDLEVSISCPAGGHGPLIAFVRDITARKRAQTALRESEERYRSLAESSPDAILLLDREVRVQYANAAAAALWGRRPAELLGRTQAELFPPEPAQRHLQLAHQAFDTAVSLRWDQQLVFPVGPGWFECRLVPVRDPQGGVSALLAIAVNITERKRAEQQLADARDLTQMMLSASPMAIVAYKASGECLFANQAITRIVGGSLPELLGQNFHDLESWQSSGLLQLAKETLADRQLRSQEFHHLSSFGKTFWIDAHMASFVFGGQLHLLLMAYDISERKRAELLLRTQRDLGVSLSMTSDLQNALESLLRAAVELEGIDCAGVYLSEPASGDLRLVAHRGLSEDFAQTAALIPAGSQGAALIRAGQPLFATYDTLPASPQQPRINREKLRAVALLPLCDNGVVLGSLHLGSHFQDEFPAQTRVVIEAVAAKAVGAIARIRTQNALRHTERQLLEISDREQARIGQEIHDGLCQQLVSLAFDANSLERQLQAAGHSEAGLARRLAFYLDQAITEARQLSRGLFPIRLNAEGLPSALEELARAAGQRFGVSCEFETTQPPIRVKNTATATHLYRIAQEALNNALKHGHARHISIRLRALPQQVELAVEDDGLGLGGLPLAQTRGMGLHIMDYRARSIGGTLRWGPGSDGGTRVCCCVPCPTG